MPGNLDGTSLAGRLLGDLREVDRAGGTRGDVYTTSLDGQGATFYTIYHDGVRRAEVWVGKDTTRLNIRERLVDPPAGSPLLTGSARKWPGGGVRVDEANLAACRALLMHVLGARRLTLADLTSREAVLAALEEFDRLGRDAFLEKYGFGPAQTFYLRHEGRLYDSKAIVGAAVGFEHPEHGPLANGWFNGGEPTVHKLEQLGFEVVSQAHAAANGRVWMVKAGRGDIHVPTCLEHSVAAVEGSELDDLSKLESPAALEAQLNERLPGRAQSTVTRDRNELYAFVKEIEVGDLVVMPQDQGRFAVGRITGDYTHRPDLPTGTTHTHPVEWLRLGVERSAVPQLGAAIGVRGFTVRQLPYAVAENVIRFVDGRAPELVLAQPEVDAFAARLGTEEYELEERNYKLAVHYVLRHLLSEPQLDSPTFPELLAAFFERRLDLDELELSTQERAFVEESVAGPPFYNVTNAFINECGGGWGVNQFVWIPGAIADGLGDPIRDAFAKLVLPGDDLAQRIDQFRDTLVAIEEQAQTLPSWRDNWKTVRPSLQFVAALLTGVDPDAYCIYHQGKLRAAYEALVGAWPKSAGGQLYADVLSFVREVGDALVRQGAPIEDLIDAQSFLWLRGEAEETSSLVEDGETAERYFILQQRAEEGYSWDEEGAIYHFTPAASGAWKQLSQSPGAAFVYYRPGSGGGETARTYFGFGRIGRIDVEGEGQARHFRAAVVDYRLLPRPVPAKEYDPRPNVQMSIAEIGRSAYVELLRRGGIASETEVPAYEEPSFEEIAQAILDGGMVLPERTIRRYHLSLKTRGFVVLSGVSGTGKTWLAQAYADAVKAKALIAPVAPNWNTNEDLLGYRSPITNTYHDTPFSQFLRDASAEWQAAEREGRKPWPYHLILDEMNLARVEYYFAKFLSAMEIRARDSSALIELAPGDVVTLGKNLSFIGTVNIDETTQMFADKVFDRAQLVELSLSEDDLRHHLEGALFRNDILEVWRIVREVAPFAFRIADEIRAYVEEAQTIGTPWQEAFDEQLFQKVLPKLKGGDLRVEAALTGLIALTNDRYPLTHGKAQAMLDGFAQHGFSSYF